MLINFQDKRMRRKKKWLSWFALLLLIVIFPEKGLAYRPSALFLDLTRVDPEQKAWQSVWAAGFGVVFPLSRNLAFFLNISRWGFEISSRDSRLLAGRLTLSPLSSGLYVLILPRKSISPLISLGGGYFFSQYRFKWEDIITIPEIIRINKKINGNFSWQAGTGLRIQLFRRASLWLHLERYQTSLAVETTIVDLNLGTIKKKESFKFTTLLYRLGLQLNL